MHNVFSPSVDNLGGIMEPMNPADIWTSHNILPNDALDPVQNLNGAKEAIDAFNVMSFLFPR